MKRFLALLTLLMAAALIGLPAQTHRPDADDPERLAQEVIARTNAVRAEHGLPPLKAQANLRDSAVWLAQDMAQHNYFDHTDRLGRSISPRLPDFGYRDFHVIGENIAGGQRTPEQVVAGWMKSPGHRANILNRDFREIGVAYAYGPHSDLKRYWVQDFGARFGVYPVVINGEAGVTHSPNVRLYIYGEGWARRMRLSNDGALWTPWELYQSNRDWTLEPGRGKRTVTVELSNGEETQRAEDSILLEPPSGSAPRS